MDSCTQVFLLLTGQPHHTDKSKWNYYSTQYEQGLFLKYWISSWNPQWEASSLAALIELMVRMKLWWLQYSTAVEGCGELWVDTVEQLFPTVTEEITQAGFGKKRWMFYLRSISRFVCFFFFQNTICYILTAAQQCTKLPWNIMWKNKNEWNVMVKHLSWVKWEPSKSHVRQW